METQTQNPFADLWWLLLLQGISAIVLGLLLLTHPVSTTEAYVMGILNILIGLWLWFNPLVAALSLPFVLGIFGLVGGAFLTYQAFQVRKQAA